MFFIKKRFLLLILACVMLAIPLLSAHLLSSSALAENAPILPEQSEFAAIEEDAAESPAKLFNAIAGFLIDVLEDFFNLDINNADLKALSVAHYFSGYLGQLVFFGNWANRRSGSFGRLMGLYGNDKNDPEIIKHEHGHYLQYQQIGFLKYIFAIAIPSLLHDSANYYSQPWEVTADLFGGVTGHYHSPGSEEAGLTYLNNVKNADLFTVISACFQG